MRKFRIVATALSVLIAVSSCKKGYLDINQNPNSASDQSVTPSLLLPQVQHQLGAYPNSGAYAFLNSWMGYWSRSGDWAIPAEEETYTTSTAFAAATWANWYNILFDNYLVENKAAAGGQTFYQGIAKIQKAYGFMYLVDQYNNVPYSKAFDISKNITPAYDNGQDIYNDLLKQLGEAADLIKAADVTKNPGIETADIIFKGDPLMWRKFANTLRLKILLRQSQISGFNPTGEIAKITAEGAGFLGAGEHVQAQPGYVAGQTGKMNPFWEAYEKNSAGNDAQTYRVANNYVLNQLKSNNDIRYKYYFDAANKPTNPADPYAGVTYGDPPVNSNAFSLVSNVAGPGLAKSATQPQWILLSFESLFMQSEAMVRGWITGDAKVTYETAVRESFIWLGVPNAVATANSYLAQTGNAKVSWADAVTPADRIKLIIQQKYFALVGINPFEVWADYRRLGYPSDIPITTNPARLSNTIPVRLRYPQAEYNLNAESVTAQGTINPYTSTVFWDK